MMKMKCSSWQMNITSLPVFHLLHIYFQTFNSVLLDVQAVELASTIDHVTLAEMNAVTWLAGLDLLQKETGTQ